MMVLRLLKASTTDLVIMNPYLIAVPATAAIPVNDAMVSSVIMYEPPSRLMLKVLVGQATKIPCGL